MTNNPLPKSFALNVTGLSKRFGALQASDNINIALETGELHALIGPNGAGKSTLINQLSGEIKADAGNIVLNGSDITKLQAFRRADLGLARTFQITELCPNFTSLENVLLAQVLNSPKRFNLWRNPRRDAALVEKAHHWLARVSLNKKANTKVKNLAHGEKRQLELAIALSRSPSVLLLDEPLAGMGPEESSQMVELLHTLKNQYTILLIEHDMDSVFRLADRVSVLVYGHIVFTGLPSEVRNSKQVQEAYLGSTDA